MHCLVDEKMPLAPENQSWINTQIDNAIAKAIAPLRPPSGWKKALYTLREWGVLGVTVTIILTLAIFAATQWNAANKRLAEEATFQTKTGDRLDKIEESLRILRVSNSALTPNSPTSQTVAKLAIAEAKKSVALPTPVVEQAGKSFTDAAPNNPGAWNVALDFVSYRSALNLPPQRRWMVLSKSPNPTPEEIKGKPGDATAYVTDEAIPCTPGATQAHLTGQPPDMCAAYLRFVGGSVVMDGGYYVNTIFENMRITYRGGPLRLENVTFVNCTFDFPQPTPETRRVALAVLESTPVTLATPKG